MTEVNFDFEGTTRVLDVPEEWLKSLSDEELKDRMIAAIRADAAIQKTAPIADTLRHGWGAIRDAYQRAKEITAYHQESAGELWEKSESYEGRSPIAAPLLGTIAALEYVYAPIEGGTRAFIGEPIADLAGEGLDLYTRIRGGDPEALNEYTKRTGAYTPQKFIEDFTTWSSQLLTPGNYARAVKSYLPINQNVGGPIGFLAGEKKPVVSAGVSLDTDIPVAPALADDVIPDSLGAVEADLTTRGAVPRLSVGSVSDITTEESLLLKVARARANPELEGERLFRTYARFLKEGLETGELDSSQIPRLLEDMEMNPVEFAKFMETSVSESGRILNLLSQASRRMARDKRYPPDLRKELDAIAGRMADGKKVDESHLANLWRRAENFRRGMLVGQVATTMRNIETQAGRLTVGIVDDALQALMRGTTVKESMSNLWNSVSADFSALPVINRMTGGKKIIDNILEGNPLTKSMLLNKTIHEVEQINKFVNAVNTLNTLQERFFRRTAFQARLQKNLKEVMGRDINTINPKEIPPELMEDAVQHALEISFAHGGKRFSKDIVEAFHKFPFLYTVNPFPRFTFANAIPFVYNHSPLGLARVFSPKTVSELAAGNSRNFSKIASRGLIGTIMLSKAIEMRNSPNAGERWYEWKTDIDPNTGSARTMNLMPYAPFSTYLFLAESMKGEDSNLLPMDYAKAVVGLNRISGTGLVLIDALRAGEGKIGGETLLKTIAQYISSPTVPMRTVKDIQQSITGEDFARDVKTDSFWEDLINPAVSNMPFLDRFLAERASPLKPGRQRSEPVNFFGFKIPSGIARQLFGVTIRDKNIVEQEVDRLGLSYSAFMPNTGLKEGDRYAAMYMAPSAVAAIPMIMKSDDPVIEVVPELSDSIVGAFDSDKSYKELSDEAKEIVLREVFGFLKKHAYAELERTHPFLWARTQIGRVGSPEAKYFEEKFGVDLRDKDEVRKLMKRFNSR